MSLHSLGMRLAGLDRARGDRRGCGPIQRSCHVIPIGKLVLLDVWGIKLYAIRREPHKTGSRATPVPGDPPGMTGCYLGGRVTTVNQKWLIDFTRSMKLVKSTGLLM